jgi:hypothetical protein
VGRKICCRPALAWGGLSLKLEMLRFPSLSLLIFRLCHVTVRRALEQLSAEGLIIRQAVVYWGIAGSDSPPTLAA